MTEQNNISTSAEPSAAPQPTGALRPLPWHFPKPSRAMCARAGRTTTGQAKAFEDLGPAGSAQLRAEPLRRPAAFGRNAPLILEIGFGMGEATAHTARVRPADNFLCCEVHEPGRRCLARALVNKTSPTFASSSTTPEVIDHMLAPGSLDGIHIFFPDPGTRKSTTSAA